MDDTKNLEITYVLKDNTFSKEQIDLIEFGLSRHGAIPGQIRYSVKQDKDGHLLVGECVVTVAQEEEAERARFERYRELAKGDPELLAELKAVYNAS